MSIINVGPGLYHDPEQPGWGFSLHSDGASGVVGHFFGFDSNRHRVWLVMNQNGILTKTNGNGFPGQYVDGVSENCGIVKLTGNGDTVQMELILTQNVMDLSAQFSPPRPWPYTHTATLVKLL